MRILGPMKNDQTNRRTAFWSAACIALVAVPLTTAMTGCRDLQKRRVELKQSSGADPELEDRFGLTSDAQDPSQRDKELGYGRWKQKPEPEGTASPTDPDRRGSTWNP